MAAIRLLNFNGQLPILSDRLLPENASADADNLLLLSGELRGVRKLQEHVDY